MAPGSLQRTFALVIPTLNEAGNIDHLLTKIISTLSNTEHDYEIVIVDDGSNDGTLEKAWHWTERDSRIRLLQRSGQRGLAGAVLYGWNQCRAELLGVMDGDLQHPPELLPDLLKETDKADVAIASRYAVNRGTDGWNPLRVAVSRLSTIAATPLISKKNLQVSDPMSGFFVMHRECIDGVKFQTTGFKLLLEILVRGHIRTVHEVPYQFGLRQSGKSKASTAVALHYLHLLSRLSWDLVLRSSQP